MHTAHDIPVAHIADQPALDRLLGALRTLHGDEYDFAVGAWFEREILQAPAGKRVSRFILTATRNARIRLAPGDPVRGPAPDGAYRALEDEWGEASEWVEEALWPGDVVTVTADQTLRLLGAGAHYFEVMSECTSYRAPRLAMLRHLRDHPAGCAAYPGAFRRQALPPEPQPANAADQRGPNRVNAHALDMRIDRDPPPIRHHHGQVPCGEGRQLNHSEIALILSRTAYGLPPVGDGREGRVVVYRRPREDPTDRFIVPVRPGSIVVTSSTEERCDGHRFENAFAMLVAIPGFVSPCRVFHQTPVDRPNAE